MFAVYIYLYNYSLIFYYLIRVNYHTTETLLGQTKVGSESITGNIIGGSGNIVFLFFVVVFSGYFFLDVFSKGIYGDLFLDVFDFFFFVFIGLKQLIDTEVGDLSGFFRKVVWLVIEHVEKAVLIINIINEVRINFINNF